MSDLFKAIGLQDDTGATAMRAFADPIDPDQAARADQVARQLGLPPVVVRSDLPGFITQAEIEATSRMLKGKPRLTEWLADPENAAIGRDDVEPMGTLESFGTALWRGGRRGVKNVQAVPPVLRSIQLEQAVRDQGKTVQELRAEILEGADSTQRPWALDEAKRRWTQAKRFSGEEAQVRGLEALGRAGQLRKEAAAIAQTPAARRFVESEGWKSALGEKDFLSGLVAAAGALASDPEGAAEFLTGVFGEMLPVLGASVATGVAAGPAAGVAVMGAGSAGLEMQAEAQDFFAENGIDISTPEGARAAFTNTELMREAARRGLTKGAIVGMFDALSGGIAGKALVRSPIGDAVLQSVAQMALGGGGEALGSLAASGEVSAADVLLEALMELPGGVVETLGVAGRRYGKDAGRAANAGQTAETLQEIDATVGQSKLAARSPEKFREFLDATDMGQLSLQVPAEDLRTFYQAKDVPIDFDGLEIDRAAYEDALVSGGDVLIKASVYATRISGTEDAAWFHANSTLDTSEMSVSEAKRFNDEVSTIIEEDAQRASEEFQAEMDARASDSQVRDAMFSQLREAGHSPDVAEREAAVWSAFFRTMGERYGANSLDLAREFGVRVEGPGRSTQTRIRDNLDIALNTLRTGLPKEKKPQSLVEFIVSRGGIAGLNEFTDAPEGLQAPEGQPDMLGGDVANSLEAVAQAALEEGFFPELQQRLAQTYEASATDTPLEDVLLAAVRAELAGEPVLRGGEGPDAEAASLRELQTEIERAGLTLDASNDEIAAALGMARTGERVLEQSAIDRIAAAKREFGDNGAKAPNWTDLVDAQQTQELLRALDNAGSAVEAGLIGDDWVVTQGKVSGVEHFVAFDLNGFPLAVGKGGERVVGFPKYVRRAMEARAVEYATHNHPTNNGFSAADYGAMLNGDMEIGMRGHDGARSRARLSEGFRESVLAAPIADFATFIARVEGVIHGALTRWLANGRIKIEQAEKTYAHIVSLALHRHGAIDLLGNSPQIIEKLGIDVADIFAETDKRIALHVGRAGYPITEVRDQGGDFGDRSTAGQVGPGSFPSGVSQGRAAAGKRGRRVQQDPRQLRLLEGRTFNPNDPRILFQEGEAPRGSITFPAGGVASGETIIRLFESHDLSSFLHEGGHFFLEAFRSLATREDTPQAMLDDLAAIDKWLGRDEADTSAYTTEQQEQWARGFEAYLMEGKAPSLELADAFSRFKAWLTRIYRTVKGLNVNLTPGVRDVMDRMLATDREIAAARDQTAMDPLFGKAPPGMSQTEFDAYQRLARRAVQTAEQSLLEKTMAKVRREREAWYRAEWKALRAEVETEVNKRREYRLIELLGNQRWLDDEGADVPDVRLNRKELTDRFGAGVIAEINQTRLGGKRAIYVDDGAPIDMVADMFGFSTPEEMIQVLQNTRKRQEAITTETNRRMAERHGDPLSDGSIEEEALAAIHTEEQAKTVAAEARQLAKQAGKDTRNITARIFRARARAMLGRMRVADVRSGRFLNAERQAARAAQREFAKVAGGQGREALETASRFKERQLLNHYLYAEARILEAEVARGREKMRRYESKKVREKLAGGYIEQIDAILEGYEFRKRTGRAVAKMESLAAYIERMTAAGRANELNIDDRLLSDANKRHYTRLTVDELRGLFDTVENIDHMGRFKQKLIDAKQKRDKDAVVGAILGAFKANVKGAPPNRIETRGERNRGRLRDFLNLTLNADTLLRAIDGYKDLGTVWRNMKEAIDGGMARVAERREKIAEDFNKLYGAYSAKEQRAMAVKKKIDGVDTAFSKWDIIAIALNTGNEQNYDRLVNGGKHAIPADQVEVALATLDERDWRFVQSAWDYLETLWPEIEAKEKRLTGTAPKRVAAKPMVPAHSFVRGGYYPIRYDSRLSGAVGDLEARELAETMMSGSFGKAQTKNGHTKARAEHVKRPLLLNLSVMHGHVDQVVRDLELGEPLANAWRILQDSRIKEAFLEAGKRSDFEALELWLLDSAAGDTISARGFEAFLRHMRTGFTISRLAFNISTALIQPSGLFQSAVVLGKKTMLHGMAEYMRNPRRWLADVSAASSLMRERERTFQRDVLHAINAADNAGGPATNRWQQLQRDVILPLSFILIQKMQYYVIDMPTWVAAYQKELGRSGIEADAVTFADSMVRRAQGSGLISDRGMLERGTTFKNSRQQEIPRMLTALGSYMFAKFNVAYERAGKTNFRSPAEAASFAVDMVLLFTLEAAVYALAKGQWPDDDDDESLAVWMARETGLSAMGTLPYMRELAGVMSGFGAGGIQGGITEALARPVAQIGQGEFDKGLIKAVWNATAIMLHLPGPQVSAMIDALFDDDLRGRSDAAPIEYLIRQSN